MSRKIILIVFVFLGSYVVSYADNGLDKTQRLLSLEECRQLVYKGRYADAIPWLEALQDSLTKEELFADSIFFQTVKFLNICYQARYDVSTNRRLLLNAIDTLAQRTRIRNTPYTRTLMYYLMRLEMGIMDYDKTLEYGYETLRMFAEVSDNSSYYCACLAQLALAWIKKGNLLLAKLYAEEALTAYKDAVLFYNFYEESDYQQLVLSAGMVAFEREDFDEAERYFREALKIGDLSIAFSNGYSMAINNLALLLVIQNRWRESLEILEEIDNIGENQELQDIILENILFSNYFLGDTDAVRQALLRWNNQKENRLLKIVGSVSEKGREGYYDNNAYLMLFANNMCAFRFNENEINKIAYNSNLSMRMLGTVVNTMLRNTSLGEEKDRIRLLTLQIDSLREMLSYKKLPLSQQQVIVKSLRQKEEERLELLPDLAESVWLKMPHFETVREQLNEDEVSLFFCEADLIHSFNEKNIHSHYIAYIVSREYEYPLLVDLCNVEAIDDYDDFDFSAEQVSALYASEKAREIYNSLWEKLELFVTDKKKVYYSTTGSLANINFEALINNDNQRLRDVYDLCYISSPALIGNIPTHLDLMACNTAALWGGINYDLSVREMQHAASQSEYFSGTDISDVLALRGETERSTWGALPGTLKEVNGLKGLLQSVGVLTKCYTGSKATEESVKQWRGNSPAILHFATHGFLISSPIESSQNNFSSGLTAYSEKNRYMLWSGLLLAGSNNKWLGKEIPENVEDGILTADEISRLDLSNTKLAVLSACETARGHIDLVEGVWGLQRAFKQAGVQTIVMSLWKIPDEPTQILMRSFYMYLLEGMEIRHALREAQNDLMRIGYQDPYYWASFVVLD